jgi:hypothetical protein
LSAAVLSDFLENFINTATLKLLCSDALIGEALAALLAARLTAFVGVRILFIEGDTQLVILAINQPLLFSYWSFANVISDISLDLLFFRNWNALKVSRCANYRAHVLAK